MGWQLLASPAAKRIHQPEIAGSASVGRTLPSASAGQALPAAFDVDFGWRSASSAAIRSLLAAKRRKNAAHGASRGKKSEADKPQRRERPVLTHTLQPLRAPPAVKATF